MYDVAIIGLGPAGATLARLLDAGLSVIAIDRKTEQGGGFAKPCGGLLATDAQKALSRFNLTLPKNVLVDPQIFAVKTIDTAQGLTRHYQRFYVNLDRDKFDRWLISLIPGRVRVEKSAACTGIAQIGDGFEIAYIQNGQTHSVRAKYIVGADGSASIVRRKLFPRRKITRYLAIQQWFPEQNTSPFYSCVFDASITDSYCWSVSKDGSFILGGAFPPDGARERFERLKSAALARGFVLGEPYKTEGCLVSMPRSPRDFCTGGQNAFLLGEAAGFISPSSLEGVSYALDSAFLLARALNERRGDPCRAYAAKCLPIKAKLIAKRLKSPFMYRPFLRKLVMKSGLSAIEVVDV